MLWSSAVFFNLFEVAEPKMTSKTSRKPNFSKLTEYLPLPKPTSLKLTSTNLALPFWFHFLVPLFVYLLF
jgi:hypothetical protein